ncbi:glycerophosphodiester phosphodiesterase GDPDL7 [Humulus lupulus]|uniref:glycerophosphodiester phosphodiesterase GDPDL7 n=1 Tax=Humulus lupulus TaxID=3486 RepID=UPI002B411726|nr:glycerophosphodiester phosphodiesterase GDPDL7 [Humulus lupulus]
MIRSLIFVSLFIHSTLAQNPSQSSPTKWQTLKGERPIVIARGGFSGLFPESSSFANQIAVSTGLPDMAVSCNLQLTKDGIGICLPDVRIDNSTTISSIYPKGQSTYKVNGQSLRGWFTVDYTSDQLLSNVTLMQNVYSRSNLFDGQLPISTVEDVTGIKPPKFWLNVPYEKFYIEHKLSPAAYIDTASKHMIINYISSPEIGFLKLMNSKVNKQKTKLIFQFLGLEDIEPTINHKYKSILQSIDSMIRPLVSGILVPKEYIWPVSNDGYLGEPTSLVDDAHKLGLEVYAYGFANDIPTSYDYNYDPTAEYTQFVDNSRFSVDGVLTDFPPTASEAIGEIISFLFLVLVIIQKPFIGGSGLTLPTLFSNAACFAHKKNESKPRKGAPLIISNNGASGIYAGSSDLAYQKAVEDGADIIDCSVQLSQDGVAFCLPSADLAGDTTAMLPFIDRKAVIPEIQPEEGVFSFDLTWNEIQTLQSQLVSPFGNSSIVRNPANKNKGNFVTLSEFLEFAKAKAVSGILINIENAAYIASHKSLDIVVKVATALTNATFDKQSTQKVLIQSDDTSVLSKFKGVPAYKRVLKIKEKIGDAPKASVDEIKKYADGVTIPRSSIVKVNDFFTVGFTNVVKEMHAANLTVYVYQLRNEYVSLAFDYFSDPIVEIATYVQAVQVDGLVTDFPGTASKYLRCPCTDTDPKANIPYAILPAEAGSLLSLIPPEIQPPAQAPAQPLDVKDVVDPPLPPLSKDNKTQETENLPQRGGSRSGLANAANVGFSLVAVMLLSLLLSFGS